MIRKEAAKLPHRKSSVRAVLPFVLCHFVDRRLREAVREAHIRARFYAHVGKGNHHIDGTVKICSLECSRSSCALATRSCLPQNLRRVASAAIEMRRAT